MGPFEQMVPEPCFQEALSPEVSARLSLGRRHFDPTRFSHHTREAPPQREARIHRPYSCVSQAVALLSGASYLQAWRPEVLGAEQPVGSPFLPVPTSLLRPSSRSDCQEAASRSSPLSSLARSLSCSVGPCLSWPAWSSQRSGPPRSLSLVRPRILALTVSRKAQSSRVLSPVLYKTTQ